MNIIILKIKMKSSGWKPRGPSEKTTIACYDDDKIIDIIKYIKLRWWMYTVFEKIWYTIKIPIQSQLNQLIKLMFWNL